MKSSSPVTSPPPCKDGNENGSDTGTIENLPQSQLGTKAYWDDVYARDLQNYNDHRDEGEIWFGTGCERRVIAWLTKAFPSRRDVAILELGCGNGHFTAALLEAGFDRLGALDYSETAVELARQLVSNDQVSIYAADILDLASIPDSESGKYHVLVDKGTFDAISLSGRDIVSEIAPAFKAALRKLSSSERTTTPLFIVTSCNWTADELKGIFGPELTPVGEIEHSSFTFGGRKGQDVSTVIFQIN